MSEFVECQNCGRTFFAENIECPYCRGEQELRERIVSVRGASGGGAMFGVLFASFMLVLAGVAVIAGLALLRARSGGMRAALGLEAGLALVTLLGLARRRRWGRRLAIAFIVANAVLGVLSVFERGQERAFAWGPGPAAMLLFLLPFLSAQARERFSR